MCPCSTCSLGFASFAWGPAAVIKLVTMTLHLLAGVLVLAFAKTQIFEVYFFRVYFGLVLLGASHALVLLPVLLSLFGPPQRQSIVQLA